MDRDAESDAAGGYLREDNGIIVGVGGYHANVLRVQPPLTISQSELEQFVESFRTVLTEEL